MKWKFWSNVTVYRSHHLCFQLLRRNNSFVKEPRALSTARRFWFLLFLPYSTSNQQTNRIIYLIAIKGSVQRPAPGEWERSIQQYTASFWPKQIYAWCSPSFRILLKPSERRYIALNVGTEVNTWNKITYIIYVFLFARIEVLISFIKDIYSENPPVVLKTRGRLNPFIAI